MNDSVVTCPYCGRSEYLLSLEGKSVAFSYLCTNCRRYIRAEERGVYQNENRGRQLLRFDGLRYGGITPTDIDGVIEYRNRLWLMYEAKMEGKEVPKGQRLAIERFIRNADIANKHGIAMIVEHNVRDPDKDIYLKDCRVRELITTENQRWRPPKYEITVKQMTDLYINYYENINGGGQSEKSISCEP